MDRSEAARPGHCQPDHGQNTFSQQWHSSIPNPHNGSAMRGKFHPRALLLQSLDFENEAAPPRILLYFRQQSNEPQERTASDSSHTTPHQACSAFVRKLL